MSRHSSEPASMASWPAALWAWRSALRALGTLHRPFDDEGDACVDDDGVLWFRWAPSRDRSEHARQLALLQVLALLVRLDRAAFEALLPDVGGEFGHHFVQYRARYEKEYRLGVYVRFDDDVSVNEVMTSLGGFQGAQASDANLAALIQQMEQRSTSSNCLIRSAIPVSLEFYHFSGGTSMIAAQTLELVRHQHSSGEREQTLPFRVCSVQFDTAGRKWIDETIAGQITELLRRGIRFPAMRFGSPFSKSATPLAILGVVQACFLPRAVHTADLQLNGLERVRLTANVSLPMLMAVTSVLAQSARMRRVDVDYARGQRGEEPPNVERLWRWLAYALFSRDARHCVQTLEINAEVLRGGAIEAVNDVLAHEDPLPRLLNVPSFASGSPSSFVIDVPAGTNIELVVENMHVKSVCASFVTSENLFGLKAVHEDQVSGHVQFFLPGWGECRAPCDSIRRREHEFSQPACSHFFTSTPVGVPHLRLEHISPRTDVAVQRLLDAVGIHVRRLDIYEPDEDVDVDDLLRQALVRCPHLESLDLFAIRLESLRWLVDAYLEGYCQIKRLKLSHITVVDMTSVHTFFDILGDGTHPMTHSLRELNFHVIERIVFDGSRGPILNSCLKMLEKNLTLRECRAVTLSRRRAQQYEERFQRFDGQLLKIRKAPLALRSKLAFLSAIEPLQSHTKRHRDYNSAQHSRLPGIGNVDILSNVFTFAAECHVRECAMELPASSW